MATRHVNHQLIERNLRFYAGWNAEFTEPDGINEVPRMRLVTLVGDGRLVRRVGYQLRCCYNLDLKRRREWCTGRAVATSLRIAELCVEVRRPRPQMLCPVTEPAGIERQLGMRLLAAPRRRADGCRR